MFDFLSVTLFIAAAGLFFYRLQYEDTPLAPFMLIALTCAVGNWLGENGAGWAAVSLLSGASFFLLHLAAAPYADDGEQERQD